MCMCMAFLRGEPAFLLIRWSCVLRGPDSLSGRSWVRQLGRNPEFHTWRESQSLVIRQLKWSISEPMSVTNVDTSCNKPWERTTRSSKALTSCQHYHIYFVRCSAHVTQQHYLDGISFLNHAGVTIIIIVCNFNNLVWIYSLI